MKLLFDQNLSPTLVHRLRDVYPGSSHVSFHGLERASDTQVRDFAYQENLVVVTKDADFVELGTLYGFPPKIVWLRLGNCTTRQIEQKLRDNQTAILQLQTEAELGIISLF